MKKLILAMMMAAVLAMVGCAGSSGQSAAASSSDQASPSSETTSSSEASTEVSTYAIELAVPEGQSGEWRTDDPNMMESNIVKLVSAEMEGGTFVARYEAVNDGSTTVNLKHYDGPACDMLYTYTLTVANGQLSQEGDPVETKAPDASVLDPFLSGKWAENESQFAELTVEKGAEGGWLAEAVTPATHSAHIYKMTLHYDCDLQKLVYDDGMTYDVPITDSEDGELGDPVATNQQGIVEMISSDDGAVVLFWNAEANSEGRDITFKRSDGNDAAYADFEKSVLGVASDELSSGDAAAADEDGQNPIMNFVGPYACDRASMMVEASGQSDAKITINWASSASENSEWVITGAFDPDKLTVNYTDAVKTNYVYNSDGSVKSQEVEYSDGIGRIIFSDTGQSSCVWENENEPENGAMEFTWSF